MRISQQQRETIGKLAQHHFGREVKVFLFGSRTDDSKKGGDIDLLLEGIREGDGSVMKKTALLADLKTALGDQKIDVIIRRKENDQSTFMQLIEKKRIRIC